MVTTVISIAISAIIAFFIAKWQMKKNKIVHFSINSYDIGKGLSNEFPEFQLHYGGEELADNVMVLKGGFINTGRNDINALKGDADIKLILPDECKIKAFTISPSTEDLIVTINKDNEKENILIFGISEIFKTDEFFKYTAIIETPKEIETLHSGLKIRHRILNTDKIKNTYIGPQRNQPVKRLYKILMISSMIMMLLLNVVLFSCHNMRYEIYKKTNNQEVEMLIDLNSNLYVDEGFSIPFITGTKISLDEFEKEYKIVPITEYRLNSSENLVAFISLLLTLGSILLTYYIAWGKNGHIMNVLKENEESTKK